MCVHKGTVLLVLFGRLPLCYYCFWAGSQKTPESLTHVLWGGSYVVLLMTTNMCVARHITFMMLLQLPGFWSWVAAAVVVVAVGGGF